MAIVRSAGTEIIRTHLFNMCGATGQRTIIQGVQHHIYTILSITAHCITRSGTESGYIRIIGYDSGGGVSADTITIAIFGVAIGETFVWNDKFSFNGYEPVDFTAGIDVTKQNAVADQGNTGTNPTGAQYLRFETDTTGTSYDLAVTFIDQNNS